MFDWAYQRKFIVTNKNVNKKNDRGKSVWKGKKKINRKRIAKDNMR